MSRRFAVVIFLVVACAACADNPVAVAPPAPVPAHTPFTTYAADPDATSYDDLDATERAVVDALEEWGDLAAGAAASAHWVRYSDAIARRTAVRAEVTP